MGPPKRDLFSLDNLLKRAQVEAASLPVPAHAKAMYKIVGVLDGRHAKSLFHHDAEYALHQTYRQLQASEVTGGLLGFNTQSDAVLREDLSVLAANTLPVAVAKVRAWNLDHKSIPRKHGAKLAYDYICLVDLLPVPPSLHELLQAAEPEAAAPDAWRHGQLPPLLLSSATPDARGAAERQPAMTVAQHETRSLALSVEAQQARLRQSAGLGMVSSDAAAPRPSHTQVGAAAARPPASAVTLYTVVEVTPRGQVRSLRCSEAVYDVATTYRQVGVSWEQGGLHGFSTLEAAAAEEEAALLLRCRLPLAVAEMRAWGAGAGVRPTSGLTRRTGLDFVRVERLLELPEDLAAGLKDAAVWRAP